MEAFALTDAATAGEPWRLWTGHFAHFGAQHALANAVACIPPLFLLRRRALVDVIIWTLLAAPLVSLLILQFTEVGEYRGASGLVVGLWCFASVVTRRRRDAGAGLGRGLPAVLLVLVAAKLIVESFWQLSPMSPPPVVEAHWFGAAAGVVGALLSSADRLTGHARRAVAQVAARPPNR